MQGMHCSAVELLHDFTQFSVDQQRAAEARKQKESEESNKWPEFV